MMNRGKVFTTAGFLLCWSVVIGGWLFTKELLNRKEESLFGKAGQIPLQSSEISFMEREEGDTAMAVEVQSAFQAAVLSEEEIEAILEICEAGGYEVLHEPKAGQMDMEQAIAAGQEWVVRLADNAVLPSSLSESGFERISAQLYAIDTETVFVENLLSFWRVSFEKENIKIELTIHAAGGQVWAAAVSVAGERMLFETEMKEEIFRLVFPFMEEGPLTMTDNKTNITYSSFAKGRVYAAMKQDALMVSGEKPVMRMRFWLCTSNTF